MGGIGWLDRYPAVEWFPRSVQMWKYVTSSSRGLFGSVVLCTEILYLQLRIAFDIHMPPSEAGIPLLEEKKPETPAIDTRLAPFSKVSRTIRDNAVPPFSLHVPKTVFSSIISEHRASIPTKHNPPQESKFRTEKVPPKRSSVQPTTIHNQKHLQRHNTHISTLIHTSPSLKKHPHPSIPPHSHSEPTSPPPAPPSPADRPSTSSPAPASAANNPPQV